MEDIKNRKYVARLVYAVLTERKTAREAILLFPETKDKSIECAYHALVHFEADEDLRYRDFDYREEQDDYLEFIASNPSVPTTEMDTVYNQQEGPYIQTFSFQNTGLMKKENPCRGI